MVGWLRGAESWLESLGVRRPVLLAVGSAGFVAAAVAGAGLSQVSQATDVARARAAVAATAAQAEHLEGLLWRARLEALTQVTASDRAAAQQAGARFDRTSRDIDQAAADLAAADQFGRAWTRVRQAQQAAERQALQGDWAGATRTVRTRLAAAADSAAAALAPVTASRRQALQQSESAARAAQLRAQVILGAILLCGAAGSLALARLAQDLVGVGVRRLAGLFRAPAPRPVTTPVPEAVVPPAPARRDHGEPAWWTAGDTGPLPSSG